METMIKVVETDSEADPYNRQKTFNINNGLGISYVISYGIYRYYKFLETKGLFR